MDRLFAAVLAAIVVCIVAAQGGERAIPRTRFTCQGRAPGYYADVDTGCQVYHMCDGMGRQFSHACPNTTLFQQRMLVCDHWYMVDCASAEDHYHANLLIGQRDKPFVTDDEMHLRTPRPDILSVPPKNNYYDGLKEAESKYSITQTNSISDDEDTVVSGNSGLDSDKNSFKPAPSASTFVPTTPKFPSRRPSTETTRDFTNKNFRQEATTIRTPNPGIDNVPSPSRELVPPFLPPTTTESTSQEFQIDARMRPAADPVVKFINRFDPNSPDPLNTSMTKKEIIDINRHLPAGQPGSEEERTPRKNKNFGNNLNTVQTDRKKGATADSRADTINTKSKAEADDIPSADPNVPSRELLPPKFDITPLVTTTMGPPIYYEWKWAVPAFDLEAPKLSNTTANSTASARPQQSRQQSRRPVYRPRSTTEEPELKTHNVEYNISSYFVPDYVFPLDGGHPGYEADEAQTSFQVAVSRPGRSSFGENPSCPQCHPAYVVPGTCEPCIVKR